MIEMIDDVETILVEYPNGEKYWIAPLPGWEFDRIAKGFPDENEFIPELMKAIIKRWEGIEFKIKDGKKSTVTDEINNVTLKAFYLKRGLRAWDLIRKARDPSTLAAGLFDEVQRKNSNGSSASS